ncbi:hypothetical protein GOBAR_AA05939 [Gossypium barbadense]|uniref:Uncharacterized protein n=1 Tax=Gossypium barbadense TaxID=3634 RepID=A0A2P5YGB8_GOSBA|nr:hypothetical protein GOBAR_AA05939 [Gossypium barbadense]
MELVNDEDVETMIALYCGNQSDQNAPTYLFAELAGVEPTEDFATYAKEHGAQEPLVILVIKRSIVIVILDEVSDDIDDEDVNDDGNINVSSIRKQIRCIMIHNNLGPHMSLIDPD